MSEIEPTRETRLQFLKTADQVDADLEAEVSRLDVAAVRAGNFGGLTKAEVRESALRERLRQVETSMRAQWAEEDRATRAPLEAAAKKLREHRRRVREYREREAALKAGDLVRVRVRRLTTLGGDGYRPGTIVEVARTVADRMIKQGDGEYETPPPPADPGIEPAIVLQRDRLIEGKLYRAGSVLLVAAMPSGLAEMLIGIGAATEAMIAPDRRPSAPQSAPAAPPKPRRRRFISDSEI